MTTVLIILALLFILLFVLNVLVKRQIKTEIVINASRSAVWDQLLNHASYPQWNPFIKEISGNPEVGLKLHVVIQGEGQKPMTFQPTVLKNDTLDEFRWVGQFITTGVMDGEHYFQLQELTPNQTRFVQGELFTGILSGLFMLLIRKNTEQGFVRMNEALKRQVEES